MRHKSSIKEAQNDNEAAHRGRRWLQREANRGENCSNDQIAFMPQNYEGSFHASR